MIFLCAPYASTVEMESASRDLEEWGNMYNISNIKYCDYYGHFYLPPTLAFEVVRFVKKTPRGSGSGSGVGYLNFGGSVLCCIEAALELKT